jgi:phage-related protein (TIGR01555 family)
VKKSALRRELKALRRKLRKPKAKLTSSTGGGASLPTPLRVVGDRPKRRIHPLTLERARQKPIKPLSALEIFKPYVPPPGVLPKGEKPMAMDSAQTDAMVAWAQSSLGAYWSEGLSFLGYAELANLTVRPEYRVISQVIATECTRKWITFQATDEAAANEEKVLATAEGEAPDDELEDDESASGGTEQVDQPAAPKGGGAEDAAPPFAAQQQDPAMADNLAKLQEAKQEKDEQRNALAKQRAEKLAGSGGKADKIKELTKEFDRLCVRDLFAKVVEFDGYFGRVHLYVDLGGNEAKPNELDRQELMTDIGDGANDVTKLKVKKDSLRRLAVVEPIWTYPQQYNSTDPLREDWYNPSQWFVMGKQIHASRLLTFVGRPVPDILKPAYGFGGLSLSQIAKPYVDNWLQTRKSVNDIIHAFSVMVLATDMSSTLETDGAAVFDRIDLFNSLRDNRGTFVLDKEGEDFKNVSAPLSSLDKLQAQAQEHMASVSRIPLVKLLGISPSGLNASSEGELKAFYDTINAYQEFALRPNLVKVMHLAMMNLWGKVDEDITFKFNPLWALTEKEEAEVRKMNAETDDILVNGVAALHPEEIRKKIATDPNSPYEGIDVADVPDAPIDDVVNLTGKEPFAKGAQGEGEEAGLKDDEEAAPEGGSPFGGQDQKPNEPSGFIIAWDEGHKRFVRTAQINWVGQDAAGWNESDHPRVKGGEHSGEFTSGGGGSGTAQAKVSKIEVPTQSQKAQWSKQLEAIKATDPEDSIRSQGAFFMSQALAAYEGTKLSQRRNVRLSVLERDNEAVAAGFAELKGTEARLRYLGSIEKGRGAEALKEIEASMKAKGAGNMLLTASAENKKFYEGQGYQARDPGNENEPEIEMYKKL